MLDYAVSNISIDHSDGKDGGVRPLPYGVVDLPSPGHEHLEWNQDLDDVALRLVNHGKVPNASVDSGYLKLTWSSQVTQIIEHVAPTCAAFADQDTLVTGSADNIVRVWRVSHGQAVPSGFVGSSARYRKHATSMLSMAYLLRGHSQCVTCITTSRAWSAIVSGSEDGSAIIWDLNRGSYRHTIWHGDENSRPKVHLTAINDSTVCALCCILTQLIRIYCHW